MHRFAKCIHIIHFQPCKHVVPSASIARCSLSHLDSPTCAHVSCVQMFKAPVQQAQCGDRAAVAVTQLDAASVERGLLAAPESVSTFPAAVALVDKIRFYAGEGGIPVSHRPLAQNCCAPIASSSTGRVKV